MLNLTHAPDQEAQTSEERPPWRRVMYALAAIPAYMLPIDRKVHTEILRPGSRTICAHQTKNWNAVRDSRGIYFSHPGRLVNSFHQRSLHGSPPTEQGAPIIKKNENCKFEHPNRASTPQVIIGVYFKQKNFRWEV